MKKYMLMLVAAGLIAAAPAYYAFQAQADEPAKTSESAVPVDEGADAASAAADSTGDSSAATDESKDDDAATTDESAPTEDGAE